LFCRSTWGPNKGCAGGPRVVISLLLRSGAANICSAEAPWGPNKGSAGGPRFVISLLLRSGAANSCSAEAAGVLIKVLLDALGL
jgi:hypothetical protein